MKNQETKNEVRIGGYELNAGLGYCFTVLSGLTIMHRFRSNVTALTQCDGRLIACTERGVYVLQKNGKRWRKIKPSPNVKLRGALQRVPLE